jgi:hypothetical protein
MAAGHPTRNDNGGLVFITRWGEPLYPNRRRRHLRPGRQALALANPCVRRKDWNDHSSAYAAHKVVRGGVELPTFRFSGLRITVQDRSRKSLWLLSDPRCTPMDTGVRGCMRLRMRLRDGHHGNGGAPGEKQRPPGGGLCAKANRESGVAWVGTEGVLVVVVAGQR